MSATIQKSSGVSQAQFATIANVSRKTVTQWKTKGFLVFESDGIVDVDASITVLRDRGLGNFGSVTPDPIEPPPPSSKVTDEDDDVSAARAAAMLMEMVDGRVAMNLLSFAEAERLKENFAALHARLRFEKDAGRLVEKEPVLRKFADLWAAERDAWEVWPSLVCGTVAAELDVDQVKLRVILEREVEKQLKARVDAAGQSGKS